MAISEMEKVREIFPDNSVIFKLNPDKPTSEIKLKSVEWQIVLQINGRNKVQDIVDELGAGENDIWPHIFNLYQKNLIIPELPAENQQDDFVEVIFFKTIEKVLINYIGPVAHYVIDDVLLDLNEKPDKFLKEKIPLLIESISQEILDDTKRVKFQREMLNYIKKL